MPSAHLIPRYTCSARNAFNPSAALAAAFTPGPPCRSTSSSTWRPPEVEDQNRSESERPLQKSAVFRKIDRLNGMINKHSVGEGPRAFNLHSSEERVPHEEASMAQDGTGPRKAFRRSYQQQYHPEDHERKARAIARHEQAKDAIARNPTFARRLNALNNNDQLEVNFQGETIPPRPDPAEDRHWSSPFVINTSIEQHQGDNWKKEQHALGRMAHEVSQKKVSPHDTASIHGRSKQLDYDAMYIDLPQSPSLLPQPVPWLANEDQVAGKDATQRLDMEIESFAHWMECTPLESVARTSLIEELTQLVTVHAGTKVNVETFGSQELGIATVLSDIDVRISFREGGSDPRQLLRRMSTVEYALMQHPDYMLVSLRAAKYPIINAQHKHTGIDIQIVSAPDTNAQREAMEHYLQTIPHLRSVYMVLKTALGIRGLVDVFNGGIGSYGLFMMLAASLQRPHKDPPKSAAACLLRFLDFYSDLDMGKYAVSVSPPKLFKKHSVFTTSTKSHIDAARRRGDDIRSAQWAIGQTRIYQPYLFCLQDPANPLNDLGRKSNAIKHLQTTIRVFRNTLRKCIEECFPTVPVELPWKDGSMLLPLVGRCHEIYRDRRLRAQKQGQIAVEGARMRDAAGQSADAEARVQDIVEMGEVREVQKATA